VDALKEEIGRLLFIHHTITDELGRTIEDIPVDAVLLEASEEAPITLNTLMLITSLRGMTTKPMLLFRSSPTTAWELQCLRDIGIDGLAVDLDKASVEAVQDLKQKMGELTRRRHPEERPSPILPTVSQASLRPPGRREEEEEEEEE
jgi:hypothetical protein